MAWGHAVLDIDVLVPVSFSNLVPTTNLSDRVLELILHPTDGAPRGPSALTDDPPIQVLSESEGVQTVPNFMTDIEYDTQSNGWSADLFKDYLEGVNER